MERNLTIHSVVLNVELLKEPTRHDWNRTSSETLSEIWNCFSMFLAVMPVQ
jgi:hypothetical protein